MQQDKPLKFAGAALLGVAGLLIGLGFPGPSGAAWGQLSGGQPSGDETLEWLGDYQEALALAKETGRPLLVEFRCSP